jgi:hypothetical protein
MEASTVFSKTLLGIASYTDSKAPLTQAERTLLIMIDGTKPMSELRRFGTVIGDCEALAEQLLERGMIEVIARTGAPATTSNTTPLVQLAELRSAAARFIANELGSYGNKLCQQIESANNVESFKTVCETAIGVLTTFKGRKTADLFQAEIVSSLEPKTATIG